MDFKKYIVSFTGEKISNPVPGEHHFVGLCLLKLLMDNMEKINKIKNINTKKINSITLDIVKEFKKVIIKNTPHGLLYEEVLEFCA